MSSKLRFSSITEMLNKQAENHSDRLCVYYPDRTDWQTYATLTYKQFNDVTNHMAQEYSNIISQNQTNETSVVCLLANSSIDYLLIMYALLKLDVIVYPLSIRNSEAATMHLLEESNVSYLFYSDEFLSISEKVATKLVPQSNATK
jgi:acyl-CoA synthetase (AMP-forming)/AMP-acid ligase II